MVELARVPETWYQNKMCVFVYQVMLFSYRFDSGSFHYPTLISYSSCLMYLDRTPPNNKGTID